MLADSTGMTTVAGAPPPQALKPVADFERVLYLEEVCDPCESNDCSYLINGAVVSDFITPHYYAPNGTAGVQYSFTGKIQAPHTVLEVGYVSFGKPVDSQWSQIVVQDGQNLVRDLGVLNIEKGKNIRKPVTLVAKSSLVAAVKFESKYASTSLSSTERTLTAMR